MSTKTDEATLPITVDEDTLTCNGATVDLTGYQDFKWGFREDKRRFWAALVDWNGKNLDLPVRTFEECKSLEALCIAYFRANNVRNNPNL